MATTVDEATNDHTDRHNATDVATMINVTLLNVWSQIERISRISMAPIHRWNLLWKLLAKYPPVLINRTNNCEITNLTNNKVDIYG